MVDDAKLLIQTFAGGAFGENGYLVQCRGTSDAILVDPGAAVREMMTEVASQNLSIHSIVLTHAHLDHVEGVAFAKRETGAPVHLHRDDLPLYGQVVAQGSMFGVDVESPPPIDAFLEEGQRITIGGCELEIRHTPGHSPGHVILVGRDVALVGDCIFAGSIGRTDLPGGDFQTLIHSIRTRILTLPDDTVLYSGHGSETTVGHERVSNPFLVPQFGGSRFG